MLTVHRLLLRGCHALSWGKPEGKWLTVCTKAVRLRLRRAYRTPAVDIRPLYRIAERC
jgi:hypothetical protein